MLERTLHRLTRLALVLALGVTAGCEDPLNPNPEPSESTDEFFGEWGRTFGFRARPLTVMTRNLFLGGDTGPVFAADFSNPVEVLQVSNAVWAEIQASDVPSRMARIAREIARERPHLISIQEAFQFTELDLSSGAPQPVQFIDLLASLEAELAARGLNYEVVRIRSNTDAVLPIAIDFGTGQVTRAVKFTDRIAVLADSRVAIDEVADDNYGATFPLAPGVELKRGWIRVATEHRGTRYHFVATHLEVQGLAPIHNAQGAELRTSVTDGLDGVVVIAGDLNSDAAGEPGEPDWTPTYGDLVDAGFVDGWVFGGRGRRERGFTCCQAPDLRNERSLLDRRIDFVLVRGEGFDPGEEHFRGIFRTHLIGHRRGDRTPDGLWPSDHAGLVTDLRVPRGRYHR